MALTGIIGKYNEIYANMGEIAMYIDFTWIYGIL